MYRLVFYILSAYLVILLFRSQQLNFSPTTIKVKDDLSAADTNQSSPFVLLRCYIINVFTTFNFQRFYEHGGEMQVAQDAPLRSSMDIFAVG